MDSARTSMLDLATVLCTRDDNTQDRDFRARTII